MYAITGDETGLLKLVNVATSTVETRFGTQTRAHAPAALTCLPTRIHTTPDLAAATTGTLVASLRHDGVLEVWDAVLGASLHSITNCGGDARLLAAHEGRFITATRTGVIRVFSQSCRDGDTGVAHSMGVEVQSAALHGHGQVLALGGKEVELRCVDVATGAVSFTARNVAVDYLDRHLPVWVKSIAFLPDTDDAAASAHASPHVLAIGTAYKQLRVYDVRASTRPVKDVALGEYPFTCMTSSADGSVIYTGDSIGTLRAVDVATMRLMGVFKGTHGCTRSVQVVGQYLLSAGLDRCLRVHHTGTRALTRQMYLKQRLVAAVWASDAGELEPREGVNHMRVTVTHGVRPVMPLTYGSGEANVKHTSAALAVARGKESTSTAVGGGSDDPWLELDRRAAAAEEEGDDDDFDFDDDDDDAMQVDDEVEVDGEDDSDSSSSASEADVPDEDDEDAYLGGGTSSHRLKQEVSRHVRGVEKNKRRVAAGAAVKKPRRGS